MTQFARNTDLILTILLKYCFSEIPFARNLICKSWNVNTNLVGEFKFAKLNIFLKMKPGSGSICKYEKLKLRHFCEIYLTVHDGNHEFDFCDKIRNEKH